MKYDYILIGNGIAGATLAYEFLERKINFLMISDPFLSSSSRVAAGIFNPVVFKRLTLGWKTDELFPYAGLFYRNAEKNLGASFYHPLKMARIFPGIEEQNNWLAKSVDGFAGRYLSKGECIDKKFLANIRAPFGYGEVERSGYMDISLFISLVNDRLKKEKKWIHRKVDHTRIVPGTNEVTVSEFKTRHIVFCEGWLVTSNPFFGNTGMKPAKGELLVIKAEGLPENVILHKSCFLLPRGNNTFLSGSTFEWEDLSENTSEKAKNDLAGKIKDLINVPFEILEQRAGIRPSSTDRKPVIGTHPVHKNLHIFNGLGTKGVVLAPYFARQFCDYLLEGKPLDKEADINRFYIS